MAGDFHATLDAYISATRAGDSEAYARCLAPEVSLYGSLTGTRLHGIAAVKGAFTAGGAILGFQHIKGFQVYGHGPEVALITPIQRPQDAEPFGFLTLLRMDDQARIVDIRLLWDPRRALLESSQREAPPTRPEVAFFFELFNAGNPEGILALLSPDVRYFGTLLGHTATGGAAIRDILALARETLAIVRLTPLQVFGHGDHLGVLVELMNTRGAVAQGVFGFVFESDGKVAEVSILWDPRPFL